MKKSDDFLNLLATAVVLVVAVLGPLVMKAIRRMSGKKEEELESPGGGPSPKPDEPMLPYEDLVNDVFGSYIERRRQEYMKQQTMSAPEPEPPAKAEPEIRIIEEGPAPPIPQAAIPTSAPPPSIEGRLFRNPRWTAGAKMIIAQEILRPPRCLAALRKRAY